MSKKYPLGRYGLGIVLFVLAAGAMLLQWHFTWDMLVAEAAEQSNEVPAFYFIWTTYWANVWENLQSEWWQVFTFVVLTKYLIFKGSHESRDSQDKFEAEVTSRLARIEQQLKNGQR